MAMVDVYFSLGSNLGDREANIAEALRRMDEAFGGRYVALSGLIETEAMGFSGGNFLNAAVLYRMRVDRGPLDKLKDRGNVASVQQDMVTEPVEATSHALIILDKVKEIERAMGRTDPPEYNSEGRRVYHSRIIDIDILFFGVEIIDTPTLTIPHTGIKERPFVMIPLLEIARPSLRKSFPEYFE